MFASSYLHYSSEQLINDGARHKTVTEDGVSYHFVRNISYNSSGYKRALGMIQYALRAARLAVKKAKSEGAPDVIIASSPHPFTMLSGLFVAKKLGAPCICEVRDFWPEVIFMSGRIRRSGIVGKILLSVEKYIYKKASALIFLKPLDTDYLYEAGLEDCVSKSFYVNNGIDTELFEIQKHKYKCDMPQGVFTVTYAGSVRPVNDIDTLLDCAKLVDDSEILFLIYGGGNMAEHISARIDNEKISNIRYMGYTEKKNLPYILSNSSLLVMNYTTKKYNWRYGNSSNKLFEYFAAGRPVLSNIRTGADFVQNYGCGISLEKATAESMSEAVKAIKNLPSEEYAELCENAALAAADFDYRKLTEKLYEAIKYTKDKREK